MMTNDMQLPAGKTCDDCVAHYHCLRLFGCPKTNTTCDWAPSRFALRIELEPEFQPERDTRTIDMFQEST
jgi:hypothetical protein